MSLDALIIEASTEDARGVVRISPAQFAKLQGTPGMTVRLMARKSTHARLVPGQIDDTKIQLDPTTFNNCGGEIGQTVRLAKAELPPVPVLQLSLDTQANTQPKDMQEALFDMALSDGDEVRIPLPNGPVVHAKVLSAGPSGAGLVGDDTTIAVEMPSHKSTEYEGIGGMSAQIERVHEMIAAPLLRQDLFEHLGIPAPRGVLFSGPPGSGKTLLARAVAARTKASFFQIDGPEILSKHYGDSEAALRRVFDAARKAQPAIIFIDEIDSLAPRRAELSSEKQVERRIVAQLLTLMDGLADRGQIIVMAATNLPDEIDPALRRPGRFDREVAFRPPNQDERLEILSVHLSKAPLATDTDLKQIASAAHGYVGADLAALAREAAMAALARCIQSTGDESSVTKQMLKVEQVDLEQGLSQTAPSALRSSAQAENTLSWDDIGGLEDIKTKLQQSAEWPRKHKGSLKDFGLSAPRGILLTGPPGSGKTMLGRALAGEASLNFIPVRPPDLLSRYLGQAERAVMELFSLARNASPSLLFFDEFDALAPCRGDGDAVFDRIVAQLLVEIDGMGDLGEITIMAATNRAAAIDPALLRPGRFDRIIEVPLPDTDMRRAIFDVHLRGRPTSNDLYLDPFVDATNGASGADIAGVVDTAAWLALGRRIRNDIDPEIGPDDLWSALGALSKRRSQTETDFIRSKGDLHDAV